MCLASPVDDNEAFICLMAIEKDFQRQGHAKELLTRAMTALGDRNISLYASPAGVPFYRKLGFSSEENPTYIYQTKFTPRKDALKGTK